MNETGHLKTKRHVSLKSIYLYMLVLSTVLLSQTVYFGMINLATFRWVYYGIIVVGLFVFTDVRCLPVNNLLTALLLCFVLLVNVGLHVNDMAANQVNEVIGFALNLVMVALMASYLGFEDFARAYVNVMVAICAISLPCVAMANFNPSLARTFVQPGYDWTVVYGYSPFYTWGINGTINYRNSGPFWEPGAFQGFILLALLLALKIKCGDIKGMRAKVFVLFATLLTTQSTTGYLLMVFMAVMEYPKLVALFGGRGKDKYFGVIFAFIMIAAISYVVVSSGNVSNKLAGTYNDSAAVRHNDLIGSAALVFQGGPLGFGDSQTRLSMEASVLDYVDNSVGALQMTYTYGWIFALIYVVILTRGIKLNMKPSGLREGLCLTVVFVVLNFTEGLYWLPVYISLMFPFLGATAEHVANNADMESRRERDAAARGGAI